jgi:hypothetical protein
VPIDRGHSVDIDHAELVILVELYMVRVQLAQPPLPSFFFSGLVGGLSYDLMTLGHAVRVWSERR